MKKLIFLSLILLLRYSYTQAQREMPAIRPADFTFSRTYDAGMLPISSKLFISKDSCIYEGNEHGKQVKKRFKLSDKQLDKIYAGLLRNEFDKIEDESTPGIVDDRGGTSIMINVNGLIIGVGDAYSSFVKDEWKEKWSNIQQDLKEVLKNKY